MVAFPIMKLAFAVIATLPLSCLADWQYRNEQDRMTSKEASYAELESTNSLALDFPYKGKNHGTITVRQHPKYGLDVLVSVEKGQMLCHSDSCGVTIRFDDAKPVRFGGTGPADHSSTAVFIHDSRRFIASAAKAKRILVQAPFFHNGEQVLEFHSSLPLQWGAAKKPSPGAAAQWPKPPAILSGTR